ncbi:flagellar biosynthesis protein FliO [Agrobacterium vitis]|nr:flagellar biosynthesis protein FliO [Agrobacterium vitis]
MIDEILNAYGARFVIAIGGVALALVVLVAVLWIIRNKAPSPFVRGGRSRQPRLQVLDAAAVDARRRLVLVRRDNIEHLILIGGPSDIVIESGIGEPKTYLAGELAANAALSEQQAPETRIAQHDKAALHMPDRALPREDPAPRPERPQQKEARPQPPREMPPKAEPVELVMPSAPPAVERAKRPEPPIIKPARPPEAAPEISRPQMRPSAPAAPSANTQPAPRPPAGPETPIAPSKIEPSAPMPPKAAETAKEDVPRVELAPATPQTPPEVRAEDAGLALETARARVLAQKVEAPKVEPFAADRIKPPVEDFDIPAPSEPTPRIDPDMESIKSEFEKILDSDVVSEPPQRPRPTVEPPVTHSIPVHAIPVTNNPQMVPSVDANQPAHGKEGNLQDEIARIFGEMGEPRKN